VATAGDGEAAVARAFECRPDLILMDVMMPRLNGYQTCRRLRTNPLTAGCPIVMLTTKDEAADAFWATEVGADAFMHKPVDFPLLLKTITDLIGPA
jgi:CheY-like chemotaxis protein